MPKLAVIPPTEADQTKLGRQIVDQQKAASRGLVENIALGALIAKANDFAERVSGTGHSDRRGNCGNAIVTKGKGLKGWLATYAENSVSRSQAYVYMDLHSYVRDELHIGKKVDLFNVLKGATLTPAEQKLREKVGAFVEGKSQRQIMFSVGKPQAKIGGARVSAKTLTPEEERAEWVEAAKARATTAFAEIHTLEERWKLLEDAKVEEAVKDAERFAKAAREWLKTPAPQRVAIDVKKYLGESTGAEA